MKKLLIFGIFLALLTAFTSVDVSARPRCGKVWIEGHYKPNGHWAKGRWKHPHWFRGYYDRYGVWVEGYCR